MRKLQTLICLMIFSSVAYAQVGGQRSFEFVNVPSNTRLTGLGGVNVSLADEDLNLAFSNPALAGDTLSGTASFNYLSYFADINAGSFIYQRDMGKYGNWFIGASYFNYGEIEGYDESGTPTTDFKAKETLIVLGRSHKVGNYTIGATVKFLNSSIAAYRANVLAIDIGAVFQHPKKHLSVGLVLKNIGLTLGDYSDGSNSKLPFDVQLGTTFKPEHMPLRFSFTAYNLYKGDIAYYNSNNPVVEDKPGTADKIFRHLTVGAELLLSKNVNFRVGYNHLVHQELKLEDTAGGAGFSYGVMFKVKAFEFSYSHGGYHAAGGSHNFGLAANTNTFYKNKK